MLFPLLQFRLRYCRDLFLHIPHVVGLSRDDTRSSELCIEELKAELTSLAKEKKSLKLEKDRLSQALARSKSLCKTSKSLCKASEEGAQQQGNELHVLVSEQRNGTQ